MAFHTSFREEWISMSAVIRDRGHFSSHPAISSFTVSYEVSATSLTLFKSELLCNALYHPPLVVIPLAASLQSSLFQCIYDFCHIGHPTRF